MKCLVTGATGFLGRLVEQHLQDCGHDVTVFVRQAAVDKKCIVGDLTQRIDLGDATFDIVFHIAGKAHITPRTKQEECDFFDVNAKGTERLLLALTRCPRLPQAVLLVSTVAVYGVDAGELLSESTPTRPTTPYGASKLSAEKAVRDWCETHHVRPAVVRLPLIAGPGVPGNLRAMVQGLKKGRYFGIGKGDARRSIVRAAEVAQILPKIALGGGVYHLTDGHHPRLMEIECALAKALGKSPPRRLPLQSARVLAGIGDFVERISGIAMPFDSGKLAKMSQTFTVSDQLARTQIGWRSERVIDHIAEVLS